MSFRFFAGIRRILAIDTNRAVVGELPRFSIREEILPRLNNKLSDTTDEGKRAEIQKLIDVWKDYADYKTPQGRSFNEGAGIIIGSLAKKYKLGDTDQDELHGYVVEKMTDGWDKLFQRFDISTGPVGLLKFFKKVVHDNVRNSIVKLFKERNVLSLDAEDEEGNSLIDKVKSEYDLPFDSYTISETKKDMKKYVSPRLPSDAARSLFNIWLDEAGDEPDNVNWKKDVIPKWVDETGMVPSYAYQFWAKIRKLIVEFLEEVEGIHLSQKLKNRLKLANSVAFGFMQSRLAKWVLAPLRAGKY